jgi:Ca-activated chloride channel family protein
MEAGETAYRRAEFDAAANAYDGLPGADAQYNHGNASRNRAVTKTRSPPTTARCARNRTCRRDRQPPRGRSRDEAQAAVRRPKRNDPRAQGKQDGKQQQQIGQSQSQQQQQQQHRAAERTPAVAKRSNNPADNQARSNPASRNASPGQAANRRNGAGQRAADARNANACSAHSARARTASRRRPGAGARGNAAGRERRLANDAWLRACPDDPGGLLRAKFRLEYERRQLEGGE